MDGLFETLGRAIGNLREQQKAEAKIASIIKSYSREKTISGVAQDCILERDFKGLAEELNKLIDCKTEQVKQLTELEAVN